MSTFGNNDLDMAVDTSGFGPEDAEPSAGNWVDAPGYYHVTCNGAKAEGNVDPDKGKLSTPCIRLDCEVLAGTEEDQVDNKLSIRLYTKKAIREDGPDGRSVVTGFEPMGEHSLKSIVSVAYAFGLIDAESLGGNLNIPWSQIAGRTAVVKVDEETDNRDANKKQYRVNFGNAWRPDSDKVADVPKDANALMLTGSASAGPVDVGSI